MDKHIGVSLGNSMFMEWQQIDAAIDRWAKGYFGKYAEACGSRDEDAFEISLGGLGLHEEDYEKYVRIFEVFDDVKDYEPEDEECFENYGVVLPAEITKRLMTEVMGGNGLKTYGTALATYDGVFFMEHDRGEQKEIDRTVETTEGKGWKVEPEADELVVRMAHMAGELETRKEIEPMEWGDLCAAIQDAIKEYYDNSSDANPFHVEDVADKVLRERFGAKPLTTVLDDAKARGNQGKVQEFDFELEP